MNMKHAATAATPRSSTFSLLLEDSSALIQASVIDGELYVSVLCPGRRAERVSSIETAVSLVFPDLPLAERLQRAATAMQKLARRIDEPAPASASFSTVSPRRF